jgi:hypothetical protein
MTEKEYRELQDRLTKKLEERSRFGYTGNKRKVYEDGILACKSILSDFYHNDPKGLIK